LISGLRGSHLAAGLAALYFATRLTNLGLLPMVSDEGTYITWGVRALHAQDFRVWLASLEDGKQPLLPWLMVPALALLEDRLIAGRLVSVLLGALNAWLTWGLTRHLLGARVAWVAAALYVIAPVALIHDRMALYDSLVTTCALAVLLAALRWSERSNLRWTLVLGLGMGAAVLTKLSALFFVALVPVAVALWRPAALRRWWLLAQAYFIAGAAYSVMYISPIVDNLTEGNFQRYSLTASEVLALPFAVWLGNSAFVAEAALAYLGPPLSLLSVAGLAWVGWRGGRAGWVLVLWALVPLLALVLTAKIMYTRYLVFCLVCTLPAAAYALVAWWERVPRARLLAVALAVVALTPPLQFGARLLFDPARAPWMDDRRWITDRFQYVESNYAGYGLRELAGELLEQAGRAPVVVLTRSATGMPRDGVTAYLLEKPNVEVALIPENDSSRTRLEREPERAYHLANQGAPVYYVLTDAPNGEQERRFATLHPEARLEQAVTKPGGHSRFLLFRLPWAPIGEDVALDPPARFDGGIKLAGFNVEKRRARPGESVRLTLYWEATARPRRDFTVFNHVARSAAGVETLAGQRDGQPSLGRRPTTDWRPGDFIADRHDIAIRSDAVPGEYELRTGLYELATLQRLAVARGASAPAHYVGLGTLTVLGP
jgi:hypothetical protein